MESGSECVPANTQAGRTTLQNTYRAVQVTAPGTLGLVELPLKQPGPGQVRLRVEACGICNSDNLTLGGLFPGLALPRVPGHEVIGTIDALGEGVQSWKVGDRVGVGFLGAYCGVCSSCRRGDFVNCRQQPMFGIHLDGGYAESMIAPARALAAVPPELESTEAAPLLCAGLTTFSALRKSKARAGDLVAIQGIGGLGHLAIQFARSMGFRVVAIARGTGKRDLALKLGAHHYIDSTNQDAAQELQTLGGARVIVSTAANSSSQSPLVPGLAPRGQLIVVGAGGDDPVALNPIDLLFGERGVEGTMTGTVPETEDTLAFSVLQNIRPIIESFPLEKAEQGFQRMTSNEARFRVVLVMKQE